ncbi:DUF305 domain-containing protein [Bosea sp. 124]|uniref:DUF305 domain-containing protein n=1 Tax=Bosea sp. 124 TaxID=2135642 RepID=UPI000D44BF3B|nr:DUF305 domain-containing protein [Bosea sp. 124]PTM39600.1 hypothetical protein C8D03_1105 [Bosea sp. 124]
MRFSPKALVSRIMDGPVPAQHTGQAAHHDHGRHGAPPGAARGPAGPTSAGVRPPATLNYDGFVQEMHVGMETMMQDMHADPPSGNPDIDFLAMMVPHHWGAVEMARLVLRDGRDPLVREIAQTILAGQQTEMQGMRGRLEALRNGVEDYPSLTGNRGP